VSQVQLDARRRQILAGARACFARHGYEGATVRRLEDETGLSRGAIFHHFADKEALFLAVAEQDAAAMRRTVAEHGLVQVMREMIAAPDAQRIGTQLAVARRLRTDPTFRGAWQPQQESLEAAVRERLQHQRQLGALRTDAEIGQLAGYLELVMEGLTAHLAAGLPADRLDAVLDLVEVSVRQG